MNNNWPCFVLILCLTMKLSDEGQLCSSCSGVEFPEQCQHHIECSNKEACPYSLESVFGKRAEGHHFQCMSCCNDTALCNQNLTCDGNVSSGIAFPKDCSELVMHDKRRSGSYYIFPSGDRHLPVSVYCEFDGTDVWTVIQRRLDGSVNFYRNWEDYKKGFGTSDGEYWLGNELIHQMTTSGAYELKIILTDFNSSSRYARYGNFHIADESHGYRLSEWGYSGNAGDAMSVHDGMKFTTFDRDNDIAPYNCAVNYHGAWWYNYCYDIRISMECTFPTTRRRIVLEFAGGFGMIPFIPSSLH